MPISRSNINGNPIATDSFVQIKVVGANAATMPLPNFLGMP